MLRKSRGERLVVVIRRVVIDELADIIIIIASFQEPDWEPVVIKAFGKEFWVATYSTCQSWTM